MRKHLNSSIIIITLSAFVFISFIKQNKAQIDTPINYLALGDSYTIGEGVEESQRWPNQIASKLKENKYKVAKTEIIAQTGWTTSDLLNAVGETKLKRYNLVSLLIGVNNQFRGQPFETFIIEFDSLLNISIELAGGKENVFVLSIPDYGVTPYGSEKKEQIAEELNMYNNYMKKKCLDQDIPFVDVTKISRELGASQGSLALDKLHPSGIQYSKWAEQALPYVLDILRHKKD